MAKPFQRFVIRNTAGQYLSAYRAQTEQGAIARFVQDQGVYASQFRNTSVVKASAVIATVEGE